MYKGTLCIHHREQMKSQRAINTSQRALIKSKRAINYITEGILNYIKEGNKCIKKGILHYITKGNMEITEDNTYITEGES